MRPVAVDPPAAAARAVAVLAAAAFVAVALALMWLRISYPFELEWMEGAMVDHVRRVVAGQTLYVAPSLEFTPFIYPPGYYYASAAVSSVVGTGFTALRLVSALSTVGVLLLVGQFVSRETGSRAVALIAAGLDRKSVG